jgi:hypothetical protein
MAESLYLVIERRKRGSWRDGNVRIAHISKKRPFLKRPSEQALVKLLITLPDRMLEPRVINVEIKPEHVAQQPVSVSPTAA